MGSVATRVLAMVGILLCLTSAAVASQGKAVFHLNNTPSACYENQDKGNMIAGVSDALWDGRRACGRRYRVRCIGAANKMPRPCRAGSVVVTVVDYCAYCKGDINLSKYAFSQIANPEAGIVVVQYDQV
ncbi:hypothetical protein Tsubulata_026564 [Turnera subulata]|uniref:Expansin-like EG45 domain-containing protein n=1 Tax=Turnera subulata TaxID=218843 RepID=A0A9Q0FXZ2_9ROSI|nr:hypothetical protein Tsubulata_026564 [Turnera subulata]